MTDAQPEFLTVAQAAALLQVSKATVRRWLEDGTLPGLKLRREWRIHRPRLIATLDTKSVPTDGIAGVRINHNLHVIVTPASLASSPK